MYTRTYPKGTEAKEIPPNYGGTALASEGEETFFADMGAPVCCEDEKTPHNGQSETTDAEATAPPCEEREQKRERPPLFEGFGTGDLLLLALAALLAQSESPDSELLIILLFLLLGNG